MIRLYRLLLWLYPVGFRKRYGPQMVQVFEDLLADARRQYHLLGVHWFWYRASSDVVVSAIKEWKNTMQKNNAFLGLLLLPTSVFFTIMFSKFVLGIDTAYDAYDSFYTDPDWSTVNWFLELLVVFSPVLALFLGMYRLLDIHFDHDANGWVSIIRVKPHVLNLTIVGISLLFVSIIAVYGFLEHFQMR